MISQKYKHTIETNIKVVAVEFANEKTNTTPKNHVEISGPDGQANTTKVAQKEITKRIIYALNHYKNN